MLYLITLKLGWEIFTFPPNWPVDLNHTFNLPILNALWTFTSGKDVNDQLWWPKAASDSRENYIIVWGIYI